MSEDDIDFLLKVVIIGDSGVGKTNLLSRFSSNMFEENTRNTIGVDFSTHDIQINNKTVKVQFWDTAGQEKYRALSSAYYKNAHGAVIVYDITRKETFDSLNNWLAELREHSVKDIQIIILGNKSDLEAQRKVTIDDGRKLAQQQGLFFMETSAKLNGDDCVGKSFHVLLEEIITKMEKEEKTENKSDLGSVKTKTVLDKKRNNKPKDGSCC